MYMKETRKKVKKSKKKFFVILSCYLAIFIITSVLTIASLSWFSGSTWATKDLYMGGPVYIHFSDASGNPTSGANKLVVHTPPGYNALYPGMNIHFEAKCVVEGGTFTHEIKYENETLIVHNTGAILRARIMVNVYQPDGRDNTAITNEIYNWVWPQLKTKALNDQSNIGVWVFDELDLDTPENNYFYYINKNQKVDEVGKNFLTEVGGKATDVSVGFLNDAIITMPPLGLTNKHAECTIKFTIVFHALQAFLPYEFADLKTPYQGDTSNRDKNVVYDDLGTAKPLTLENSRRVFNEAIRDIYPGEPTT